MGAVTRAVAAVGVLAIAFAAPAVGATPQLTFSPSKVGFGDRVTLRVVVQVDDRQVRPDSFRVTSGVAPLTQLGRPATHRRSNGHATTISVTIAAACLADACVARPRVTPIHLPPLTARVTGADGAARTLTARWGQLQVVGRVSAHDLAAAKPPFRADTSIASPTFRFAPRSLALLLDALAALLATVAASLIARHVVVAHRRRHPPAVPDELTIAVQRVRESQRRTTPDRRRALGNLARVLHRRGLRLADASSDLAWSRPEPTAERVETFAGRVDDERPA